MCIRDRRSDVVNEHAGQANNRARNATSITTWPVPSTSARSTPVTRRPGRSKTRWSKVVARMGGSRIGDCRSLRTYGPPMRATTLLNRVFDLPGVRVTGVDLDEVDGTGQVVIEVALRARLLACPACSFTTSLRYDLRDVDSSWRHLDLGGRVCRLRMRRRRLRCPTHVVVTQKVPFARPGARSPPHDLSEIRVCPDLSRTIRTEPAAGVHPGRWWSCSLPLGHWRAWAACPSSCARRSVGPGPPSRQVRPTGCSCASRCPSVPRCRRWRGSCAAAGRRG